MSTNSAKAHQVQDRVLPAEILEDIFVLLDDAADVVRASAACKSHRRVVCDPRFLRRYRFLHSPPVLGLLDSMGTGAFLHAEAPHKAAGAGAALAAAADFTFSFLPTDPNPNPTNAFHRRWISRDARDGRVLLSRRSAADRRATFLELVICDPLHRRHKEIPPVPEDLWPTRYSAEVKSEPFLLPAREKEDESKFRVIYNWVSRYKFIAFLFDSETGEWSVPAFFNFWPDRPIHNPMDLVRYYAGGCFYWARRRSESRMLVLDPLAMEFSMAGLPSGTGIGGDHDLQELAVVDAAGGVNRLGVIALRYGGKLDLYSKAGQNNTGGSAEEWRHDMRHSLPGSYLPESYRHCCIIGAAEGCLVLIDDSTAKLKYFIMDPKTFLVERFCESKPQYAVVHHALPYARFPPPLSPPSI